MTVGSELEKIKTQIGEKKTMTIKYFEGLLDARKMMQRMLAEKPKAHEDARMIEESEGDEKLIYEISLDQKAVLHYQIKVLDNRIVKASLERIRNLKKQK